MKQLLGLVFFCALFLLVNNPANAQSNGQWIYYPDPYNGQPRQCFLPVGSTMCLAYPPQQVYTPQPQYSGYPQSYPQQPYPQYPNYGNNCQQGCPAEETQRRKYRRSDWDVVSNGYNRLPSIRYSRTREEEIIVIETTNTNWRPQVYVGTNGSRYYRSW
jgi:hypothetical protein